MVADELTPDRSGRLNVGEHDIWWEYHGAGDRPVACLLNGLAMHTQAWYHFVPMLADEVDLVLYDYPGQGRSSTADTEVEIPELARYLTLIMDEVGVDRVHLMGISYGGFTALEFARLYQDRLHTLTLSGILATDEKLFRMYEDISLRFYRSTREVFDLYTHYMYEKIFGERFVSTVPPEQLEAMRRRFFERYVDQRHCLIRLTEAQHRHLEALDEKVAGYRAVETPTLVVSGEQDRVLPLWQQEKLLDIFANSRWEIVPDSGHVVYLERPDVFFPMLKRFMRSRSVDF